MESDRSPRTPDTDLATAADHPGRDVVIFDGDCEFCTQQVRRLSRWDRNDQLAYVSLHEPLVAERYPQLDREQLMEQMYVVDTQGRAYGGADALRYLSTRLPRMKWLRPVLHFPGLMPLWRWLYQQVARRRYRLAKRRGECPSGHCRLHDD